MIKSESLRNEIQNCELRVANDELKKDLEEIAMQRRVETDAFLGIETELSHAMDAVFQTPQGSGLTIREKVENLVQNCVSTQAALKEADAERSKLKIVHHKIEKIVNALRTMPLQILPKNVLSLIEELFFVFGITLRKKDKDEVDHQ